MGLVLAADLPDDLAMEFNLAFYDELAMGVEIRVAFERAMRVVRSSHPVSSWAALLMLQGQSPNLGGQSADSWTPTDTRGSDLPYGGGF